MILATQQQRAFYKMEAILPGVIIMWFVESSFHMAMFVTAWHHGLSGNRIDIFSICIEIGNKSANGTVAHLVLTSQKYGYQSLIMISNEGP